MVIFLVLLEIIALLFSLILSGGDSYFFKQGSYFTSIAIFIFLLIPITCKIRNVSLQFSTFYIILSICFSFFHHI